MLAPKDNLQMTNFCSIPLEESPCRKRKIIHSNIYRILPKVNQVIYTLDTICMPNIMTLAQAVFQIFCSQCCFSTQNNMSEKGASVYETLCPQHMLAPKDNLQMTNFCSIPLEESPCRKRKIIHSNIYRILPKVNQVIYTLDTICMPNIMTLAQAILQIFCSQGPLWVKNLSLKRAIIQSNFDRIL